VRLVPSAERGASQQALMVDARRRLARVWGLEAAVLAPGGPGGTAAPLQVQLRGPDVATLQGLSERALAAVRAIPGVVDARSSLGAPRPELRVDVDRAAATRLGIDFDDVAGTVRPLFAGAVATRWEDAAGEERDVVVRLPAALRRAPDDVRRLALPTGATTPGGAAVAVPLGAVARVTRAAAPAQIDRLGLQRVVTLSAATAPELSLSDASARIRERLAAVPLPPGYAVALGGDTEQLEETAGYMLEAVALAVILIFLILASQFESVAQPFAIMLSLPLSLVGVLLALLATGTTLNIMSMIGVIMLLGLVTKNAILLVDNANERRRAGADRRAALAQAGAVRLRPIVMTTVAMIAGMLPVALALGEGGGFRAPMARAVIGGLITSTLLTLVVVPVAYTYFDDAGGWLRALPRRVGGRVRGFRRPGRPPRPPAAEPAFGD
jgi:HAE1 family hydrophobic/amphiphilic exporter-1